MNPPTIANFSQILETIIKSAIIFVGMATMFTIMISGFKFLTAGGDKEATQKAQKTLTYAIIGLVVTVSAWMLIYILGMFFGKDFTVFGICINGSFDPTTGGCR